MKLQFRRRALILLALLTCAAVVAPAALRAQSALAEARTPERYAPAIAFARTLVEAAMAESGTPGMSVAVGLDGAVVWSEGFGYADVEGRVPVWEETRFRIGSVSKSLTAAAVGLLVERGTLDLDARVQRYVPSFPEKRWPLTTRQVAGHLAGIRHYDGDEFLSSRRYATVAEGLEIFQDDTLLFEPGTRYSYSSYGWNLISAVIEGVSNAEFLAFMDAEVFKPLEMRHTIADHTDSIIPQRTRFYHRNDDGRVVNAPYVDNSYKWAGGGFLSTPEDLVRFGFAHLRDDFLKDETIELLWTPQATVDGESTGYGIGWGVALDDKGRVSTASHGGGSMGGTTAFVVLPQQGAVLGLTGNLTQAPTGGALPRLVLDAFLEPETLFTDTPGPDIAGVWECRATAGERQVGTGALAMHGTAPDLWGRVEWTNDTTDRIVHAAAGPDGLLLVTVDGAGRITRLRFTAIEDDRLEGDWLGGGRGELVCGR